jgi:hypothetical protein
VAAARLFVDDDESALDEEEEEEVGVQGRHRGPAPWEIEQDDLDEQTLNDWTNEAAAPPVAPVAAALAVRQAFTPPPPLLPPVAAGVERRSVSFRTKEKQILDEVISTIFLYI